MNGTHDERYQRAVDVFLRACDVPEERRDAFLREACAGDAELLGVARDLLDHDASDEDLFARAATGVHELLAQEDGGELPLPERIGSFRVLGRIGEGGMGIVYEAEQESPRRSVALKVVRPGMATPRNLRRFELESDVLGRLEHTGIARVYEAGMAETPWGLVPYFAMERVRGRSLLAHCAERALGTHERLELLARVCDAVEHAHGKGVVHRDLKSSNVLVAENGDPKILDFGVARLVERGTDAATELTLSGQMVGTMGTMSPEQVRGDSRAIDARTDVYALGAIGYELLSGRPPLDVVDKALTEAARIVLESEPAPLSSVDPTFRGDLDVIFATALEKEAARRYASASALAADLRRHLRDEPILARAPSAATLIRKFARRNRALVAGTVAVFAALAAGGGVATWKAIEATRSERASRRQTYRASLAAASAALRVHDVGGAMQRLDAAPEELRGWEWRHLRSRIDESLAVCKIGKAAVLAIDVSPDGRRVAASTADGRVELWSIDGARLSPPSSTGARLDSVKFMPGGERLLAVREGADRARGQTLALPSLAIESSWESPMPRATGASFNADGSRLVRAAGRSVVVVDTMSGARATTWDLKVVDDLAARFSPDGLRVAIAHSGGFEVRDARDGQVLVERRNIGGANVATFSPDGTKLVVAMYGPEARICDAATGADLQLLDGHAAGVSDACFSPDGASVATGSVDGSVRLWSTELGAFRHAIHGHVGRVRRVIFTPDGERLVTASEDGTVRIWGAVEAGEPFELRYGNKDQNVYMAVFSPDGRRLATGSLSEGNPTLRLWDVATGAPIAAWLERHVMSLAWSPDGARLAVGGHNFATEQMDAATGAVVARSPPHFYNTDSVAYDPTSRSLVSAGLDGVVRLDDAASGRVLAKHKLGGRQWGSSPIYKALFSPDGAWITASCSDGSIDVLEAATLKPITKWKAHTGPLTALATSRDGRWLASGTKGGEIAIWRTGSWELVARLRNHADEVFALAFSRDGSRLVSGGRDRTIRVWDTESWDVVLQLVGHTKYVYSLAFSPDGETLASASGDGTVRLWGVRTRAERHELQRAR